MKPLIPSHREKKRYLLVKSESFGIDIKDFRKQIIISIEQFLGVLGMAKTSLKFIDSGSNKNKTWAILCVNREMLEKVRAAFCVFSKEKIEVENVSGTLKKLRNQSENKGS